MSDTKPTPYTREWYLAEVTQEIRLKKQLTQAALEMANVAELAGIREVLEGLLHYLTAERTIEQTVGFMMPQIIRKGDTEDE